MGDADSTDATHRCPDRQRDQEPGEPGQLHDEQRRCASDTGQQVVREIEQDPQPSEDRQGSKCRRRRLPALAVHQANRRPGEYGERCGEHEAEHGEQPHRSRERLLEGFAIICELGKSGDGDPANGDRQQIRRPTRQIEREQVQPERRGAEQATDDHVIDVQRGKQHEARSGQREADAQQRGRIIVVPARSGPRRRERKHQHGCGDVAGECSPCQADRTVTVGREQDAHERRRNERDQVGDGSATLLKCPGHQGTGNRRHAVDQHADSENADHRHRARARRFPRRPSARRRTRKGTAANSCAIASDVAVRAARRMSPCHRTTATLTPSSFMLCRTASTTIATAKRAVLVGSEQARQDEPDEDRDEPTGDAVEQAPAECPSRSALHR